MTSTIEQVVQRFRARARMVAFARASILAGAAAAVAAVAWNAATANTTARGLMVLAATLVAALLCAAVWAVRRTPTLMATAALIDRALGLPNQIVASVQVARDESAVASLIVRAAMRRLRDVAPPVVIPFDRGRHCVAASVVIAGAFLATATGAFQPASRSAAPLTAHGAASFPGAITAGRQQSGTKPAEAAQAAAQASSLRRIATENAHREVSDSTTANVAKAADSKPQTSASGEAATLPSSQLVQGSSVSHARSREETRGESAAQRATANSLGSPVEDGSRNARGRSTAMSSTSKEYTGSGGATDDSGAVGKGTGGIGAGRLQEAAATGNSPRATTRPMTGITASAARAQAEAALTRDDIPPALRGYVRDYFLRLQLAGRR